MVPSADALSGEPRVDSIKKDTEVKKFLGVVRA